ncbi:hypothetical protein SK128_018572 [Halocaridina rubra]|uniref:Uncharacterized protein n=1 Tax=Halocaridina rubra TaxID=373956 RepID=A0AAN8WYC1_HALRR
MVSSESVSWQPIACFCVYTSEYYLMASVSLGVKQQKKTIMILSVSAALLGLVTAYPAKADLTRYQDGQGLNYEGYDEPSDHSGQGGLPRESALEGPGSGTAESSISYSLGAAPSDYDAHQGQNSQGGSGGYARQSAHGNQPAYGGQGNNYGGQAVGIRKPQDEYRYQNYDDDDHDIYTN